MELQIYTITEHIGRNYEAGIFVERAERSTQTNMEANSCEEARADVNLCRCPIFSQGVSL